MSYEERIQKLYADLAARDGEAMAAAYDPDARFQDPVFGEMEGERIGDMWRMLTSTSSGIEVTVSDVLVQGDRGSATWEARYVFTPSGREVLNRIEARYRFTEEGLILRHVDGFSFGAWARQALGTTGLLLGWTPYLRNRVRREAHASLDAFVADRRNP